MNTKKILKHIKSYIKSKGYIFQDGLVENLFLCLKSKPFVILSGPDGCGKHTFAKLFAQSIGATKENGRFKFVCVGANKHSSEFLLGYKAGDGSFVQGELTAIWREALCNADKPYFVFIDDMNLSCPQEYMTEIFKTLDTRCRTEKGKLTSEYLFDKSYFQKEKDQKSFGELPYPENLYIIASVSSNNMHTSMLGGLKTIDRAFVIEMEPELSNAFFQKEENEPEKLDVDNDFLKTEYVELNECPQREFIEMANSTIVEFNKPSKFTSSGLSYRTRNEMLFYLILCNEYEIFDEQKAMDMVIMQRMLPRIYGGEGYVKTTLGFIFKMCVHQSGDDYASSSFKMFRSISGPGVRYEKTARKITHMIRKFEEKGVCSFWD